MPFLHLENFLDEKLNAEILNYAIENQDSFLPSTVSSQGMSSVSPVRVSLTFKDLGPYKSILEEKLHSSIPAMLEALEVPSFPVATIELNLAAHGDGAFFKTHIDTAIHEKTQTRRMISAVYYLHSQPRKFTGGNLVIHPLPIGTENDESKEIIPENNSLAVFPSFSPHEVLPIIAPNLPFKDWRFAVNCWIHKV
ncbi:2OG-Fe(II) oxygenase [Dyadobacter sp. CY261]|uniref:2OG-Fe(II) oxygenase n=1 Tax=Dyadobacter sp. CY261 TaxID=2907203 RepID=UPI001F1BA12C|nr:2OG-Fe(II) oxygenase [Dyadobacter sp. CY261]MCF0069601.1 2OG-Fe(II) oxygenase [Dyadobacter sp. CY261]